MSRTGFAGFVAFDGFSGLRIEFGGAKTIVVEVLSLRLRMTLRNPKHRNCNYR